MGQFFISDKSIRFDCDCENPYQPIVDKKAKSIKCERCKKKFTNPFHKSNPYNLDDRYINPPQVQGVDLKNYHTILITIILTSLLSGIALYILELKFNLSPINFLSLDPACADLIKSVNCSISFASQLSKSFLIPFPILCDEVNGNVLLY